MTAGEVDWDRVVPVAAATKKRRQGKAAKKQRARTQLSEQAPIPPEQAPIPPIFTKLGAYYRFGSGESVRGFIEDL